MKFDEKIHRKILDQKNSEILPIPHSEKPRNITDSSLRKISCFFFRYKATLTPIIAVHYFSFFYLT